MPPTVDSYRFLSGITRRMVETWIKLEPPRPIPWTPLAKPLAECTVALFSTGGIALKSDRPFDQEGERRDPWRGDPSYRVIPKTASAEDIEVYHLHINPEFARRDLNCILPLERLSELEANGEIGRVAPSHYSIMGYLPKADEMLRESIPPIVETLRAEGVDAALLVPV